VREFLENLRPLSNSDFDEFFSTNPHYKGVFLNNKKLSKELTSLKKSDFIVINLANKPPGTHWVGLKISDTGTWMYFDSFGAPPTARVSNAHTKIHKVLKEPIQPITSPLCGYYVLLFLIQASSKKSAKSFVSSLESLPPTTPDKLICGDGLFLNRQISVDYSNKSRAILEEFGDWEIESYQLNREPIQKTYKIIANIITLGQFNRNLQRLGYDDVYHLSVALVLRKGDATKSHVVRIEKNHVVSLEALTDRASQVLPPQPISLHKLHAPRHITLKESMEKTRKKMGDNAFFSYDSLDNNCQIFVLNWMQANDIVFPGSRDWVLQSATQLIENNPRIKQLLRLTTDGAAIVQRLLDGR